MTTQLKMAEEDERLADITSCSLCNATSRVPKRLPCFHIFCINCLQAKTSTSRTHSRKNIPCPVCKTAFSLPTEGLGALHTDSFVQRLTKVNEILNLSSGNLLCDACQEESDAADDIPLVHMYCVHCCMTLCENCCRPHKKSEVYKDHTLVNLRNRTLSKDLLEIFASNNCTKHTKEQLKMYCSDCKCVVCALCYMESHQTHRWSELELVSNQFRMQIQTNVSSLSRCGQDISNKVQLLQKEKSDTIQRTSQIKALVVAAKHGLKSFVDNHADTLIQQIESLMTRKLAEIETDHESLTRELSTLRSYLSYAKELERKGSSSDVCKAVDNLAERLVDLENFKKCRQSRQTTQLRIDFKKSKLEDFLRTHGGNSVGKVYVDKGVKTKTENRECWLEDILSKPEKLQQELNENKATIKDLKSANEQLKQSLNRANFLTYQQRHELESQKRNSASLQAVIDKQKLQLEKEKEVYMSLKASVVEKTMMKKKESHEERSIGDQQNEDDFKEVMKTRTLQTMIDELKEKLDKETQYNKNLQKIIDKQKQEADCEKVVQISLQKNFEKSQKELEECRLEIGKIQQVHTEQMKELNVGQQKEKNEWTEIAELLQKKVNEKDQHITVKEKMIETLNEKARHLEQLLEPAKQNDDSTVTTTQGILRRNQNPVLNHTIARPPTGSNSVLGLAVLGNDLFLISGSNSEIEIFDSTTFSFKHKAVVKGLTNPQDIVSCPKYECLYIMDLQRIKYVMRVESTGNLIRKWSTGNDGGRLSVTKNSTVIVTFYYTNQLREYTCDGEMLHQVQFSKDSGIVHPWHAVELNNGHFVVCFGSRTDSENKICIVDRNGNVLLSFGGKRGSPIGQLNCPLYLAVNNAGNILVADQNNSRLLLLSPELKFIRELVSINAKDGTRRLSKFYLNESKGKLFLTHNDWDWNLSPGKVLVFDVDQN